MKKTKKTIMTKDLKEKLPLLIIAAASVITFTLIVTFSLQEKIWDKVTNEMCTSTPFIKQKQIKAQQQPTALEPLSEDGKQAIDNEIINMEKDLDSVSEVSTDDLSDIENTL